MRGIVAVLILGLLGASVAARAEKIKPARYVSLNTPGALEKLRDSNSAHHETIQNIVLGLANRRYGEIRQWLRTTYQAEDVSISYFMLTTSPGQRDLSFVLGDTQYYGRVISLPSGGTVFLIGNR